MIFLRNYREKQKKRKKEKTAHLRIWRAYALLVSLWSPLLSTKYCEFLFSAECCLARLNVYVY